jgi:predicted nucleotidyltransferase
MNIDEFRQEIKNGCLSVSKESIKKAVQSFDARVRAIENTKGAYLEKRKINKN